MFLGFNAEIFQQSIAGKINYFGMVTGESDPLANKLKDKFYEVSEMSYQYPCI